jgi:outer membrane protein TolC
MRKPVPITGLLSLFLLALHFLGATASYGQATALGERQTLSLKACLQMAMEKNHSRPASQFAVAAAEAQHRQSLAAYWPQVTFKSGITQLDQAPNFVFPAITVPVSPQSVSIPGGTASVTIPANAFGPGFPPSPVQMPVSFPGQTVNTSAQTLPVPAQTVKLMNPTTENVAGDFNWLLLDGGMRRGYREQALGGLDAARAESRRTDLELADSVIRLYYGAVLARQLRQIGYDTLERMEATLRVTESLYQNGSGTVNKTDYLDNKVMVETVRSMVAPLEKNEASAEAALAYTIGLSWKASVIPEDREVPFQAYAGNLDELVATTYEFNPDWAKIDAGLRALEGERLTAVSGHYPKVGLKGELYRWWNSYEGGLSTPQNRGGWTVGLGVEIPLWDGFLTTAKVAEARARINQLKQRKLLLQEGLGLQIRDLFLELAAAEKVCRATGDALSAARDDRELTVRAYQSGLVSTEKVIRAQLQEALVDAAHYKAVYDHRALQSRIDLVVGRSVQAQFSSGP